MGRLFYLALYLFCCISAGVQAQDKPCADVGVTSTSDIQVGSIFVLEVPRLLRESLVLTCVVTLDGGSPTPTIVNYVWMKNGDILPQYNESVLQIASISSDDGGSYSCGAVTDAPCVTVTSDATFVTTPPSVSLDPSSNFAVNEGERVQINCSVQGWPTPDIEWTRSSSGNTVVTISSNPVWIIDTASVSDSGDYTCIGTNNRGNDRDTVTVTVNEVTDPPTQPTTAPPQSTSAETGDSNTGNIQVTIAPPQPEIGFYIGIAVSAFVHLVLIIITIVSVVIWVLRKRAAERSAQAEQYEEETL